MLRLQPVDGENHPVTTKDETNLFFYYLSFARYFSINRWTRLCHPPYFFQVLFPVDRIRYPFFFFSLTLYIRGMGWLEEGRKKVDWLSVPHGVLRCLRFGEYPLFIFRTASWWVGERFSSYLFMLASSTCVLVSTTGLRLSGWSVCFSSSRGPVFYRTGWWLAS
jgi:hypothetical protein